MDLGEPEDARRGRTIAGSAVDAEEKNVLFEQYKLAVEMADRVSARRGAANGFFFTVTTALLAASESFGLSLAAGAGLVLSSAWWWQLRSYRTLSAAKWKVIGDLERNLPALPFTDEWIEIKKDPVERAVAHFAWVARIVQPFARYAELSLVEQVVPFVFFILFAVSLARALA
jgi:hypothetical protein